jgi:hypothetical protein
MTRSARKRVDFDWDAPTAGIGKAPILLPEVDTRALAAVALAAQEATLRARAREILADQPLDEDQLDEIVATLNGIEQNLHAARDRMLDMGRLLVRLTAAAGEGGYDKLLRAGLVAVSRTMASKLRRVAEAVDAGRLPADRLPSAIRTSYYLTTLPPPQIEQLIAADALTPTATITTLRRVLGETDAASTAAERNKLLVQLRYHQAKVRTLEQQLARLHEVAS